MISSLRKIPYSLLLGLLLLPLACLSQETRGTLVGQIRDASGAIVPGGGVSAKNLDTGVTTSTATNAAGIFELPFLVNGRYELRANATGFRPFLQPEILVAGGSRLTVDISLEVGDASSSVTVDSQTPLLNTATASASQVIEKRLVLGLPTSSNSAMLQVSLAAGMQRTSFNNFNSHTVNASSAQSTSGGVGGNEVFIDGTPNSGQQRRTAWLPYTEGIEEIRVETTPFDASVGNSTGAFITMTTKAGTNLYHGSASDTHWQQRWNATPANDVANYNARIAAAEAAGNSALAQRLRAEPKQPAGRSNTYAVTLGGPVAIPKLFNGRNRLFFFFLYQGQKERFRDLDASRKLYTVPTADERTGDFSRLLGINAARFQIYDPLTTRFDTPSGLFVRQPFAGNRIPANRILNPMVKAYNAIYPLPNGSAAADIEGRNNYFADPQVKYDYFALQNRIDYVATASDRLFFRWSYNKFFNDRNDWTFETVPGLHSESLDRRNTGIGLDWVHTFNSSSILNITASYNRHPDNRPLNPVQWQYKPTDVGLPSYLDDKAGDFHTLPYVQFTEYRSVSDQRVVSLPTSVSSLRANFSKFAGRHSLSFGYDGRVYYGLGGDSGLGYPGYTSGLFGFTNDLLRGTSATAGVGSLGTEYAAFLLGIPSTTRVDTNDTYYATTPRHSFFAQDSFRVNSKLTLTLGLRMEMELGIRERFNRGLRDFNTGATLAISSAAEAAYALSPLPEVAASAFRVRGGVNYLGAGDTPNRYTNTTYRFLPRLGFAYSLDSKTVIRGGYGTYYDTLNSSLAFLNQFGFSRSTLTNITNDQGVTWNYNYFTNNNPPTSNPFPVRADGTRFDVPFGNTLGVDSLTGSSFAFIAPDFQPAKQQRVRLEVERQIPFNAVVGASYNWSYVGNFGVNQELNALPGKYWATGNTRNNAIESELNRNVTNPFFIGNFQSLQSSNPQLYQQMSNSSFFASRTIRKQQLLRPFPHLTSLVERQKPIGEFKYNAMILRLEKRFSRGLVFNTHYEWSHTMSRDFFNNPFDEQPSWRESDTSRPHRWVITSVYELPFGKGRRWLGGNGILRALTGGWQIGAAWQRQSGEAIDFGNVFYYGDNWRDIELPAGERTIGQWFDTTLFERNAARGPATFHTRQFPNRLNWLRTAPLLNLDANAQKSIRVTEGISATLRGDFINALNHQVPLNPGANPLAADFGRVTTYVNGPRVIQITLRVAF